MGDRHSTHAHGDERPGHPHGHDHAHDQVHDHVHKNAHDHAPHTHDDDGHHDHSHDHSHHHHHRALGRQALLTSLVLNAAFLVIEAAVGVWSSSLALLSDAAHMLSDVVSLAIALVAAQVRMRPRDAVSTFGYARVAVVGGLANATLALMAAAWIVVEAFERLQAPRDVPGVPVLATAVVGLVVNVVSAWWLHRSGDRSVNMRAALVHMLGDALGSVAAIVAGAVLVLGGPVVVDPIASVVVGAIVVGSAISLMRDAVHILLERAPRGLSLEAVRATLAADPAIRDVVGLHVWSLDDGDVVATVVIVVDAPSVIEAAVVVARARAALGERHGIAHATIEVRPIGEVAPCC
jgi:cobalt-zinc-cadmium efflux system protein